MTARASAPPVRSGTVPALAAEFTLRPQTMPGLATLLAPGTAVALVSAATGSSGQPGSSCGKTQLAVYLADQLWRSGQVAFLAWVDASSRASALSGYAEAAAAAGIEAGGSAEQVAGRLAGWLAATARPWLIVLDDLRDAADLDGLWPSGPAGRTLITAQDERVVPASPGSGGEPWERVVPVGPFSAREALSYLMASLAGDADQRHGAIDLAIALGGDPVALAHASAVIATTSWSCHEYQQRYADRCARLAVRQPCDQPSAVTWLLSAERAEQIAPGGAARGLLELAALLDGQAIPATLFTTQAVGGYLARAGSPGGADQAWQAVEALEDTGLITVDQAAATPVVRVSRHVAALALAPMGETALQRAAWAVADGLAEIWPRDEAEPWTAAGLRSCADVLARAAGDLLWTTDGCHPLLRTAGHSADAARLTGPAVRHWAQLVTTSERITGAGSPHTLTAASQLAQALHAAGNAQQAVSWWQWVAAGYSRVSGPDHPATLAAQVGLGQALAAAGRPGDAIAALDQAVIGYERTCGAGHPDTFRARSELAAACQAAGRVAEAIGHYRRNLAEQERIHGARHLASITAREQLAAACLEAGQMKEALTAYRKALADREKIQGADDLDTITARRNLASACQAAGQISAALQLHDQACASYQEVLGADHPITLACQADLANSYNAAGRLADAAALLRDTLTRCQQALPPGHPLTTSVQQALTSIASP